MAGSPGKGPGGKPAPASRKVSPQTEVAAASGPPTALDAPQPLAQLVSSGQSVLRIENETMTQVARQFPRQELAVYEGAVRELDLAPEFAKTAFYAIPYRNEYGGVTMVEGPSIKAAMALARRWGNCSNGARIIDEQDERVIVEGVFVDFQTGLRTLRTVSVSKVAWNRKAGRYLPLRPDRLNLSIQAGMSKAVRNAILASLPASLVSSYYEKAKALASTDTGKSKASISAELQSELVRLGATKEQVARYCEQPEIKGKSAETLIASLTGLLNAIRDGQTTLEEALGGGEPKADAPQKVQGPVNVDDLL